MEGIINVTTMSKSPLRPHVYSNRRGHDVDQYFQSTINNNNKPNRLMTTTNKTAAVQLSGSETDVSTTSTENLTCEEEYVLRNSTRQEPQGEESMQLEPSITVVNGRSLTVQKNSGEELNKSINDGVVPSSKDPVSSGASLSSSAVVSNNNNNRANNNWTKSIDFDMSKLPSPPEYPGWLQSELSSATNYKQMAGSMETTEDQQSWEDQLPSAVSSVTGSMSRSQPDLSNLDRWDVEMHGINSSSTNDQRYLQNNYRSHTKGKSSPTKMLVGADAIFVNTSPTRGLIGGHHKYRSHGDLQFVDMLLAENRQLKYELESVSHKVYKLQQFECEIQKVHKAHEELIKSSQRREDLEQKVKNKLQFELMRCQELNRKLKAQVEVTVGQQMLSRQQSLLSSGDSIREATDGRDSLVAQLIQQNKELLGAKERHEIELAAQRATLQEQRTHIEILDSALTNAQANVVRLEEECRKKQSHLERVEQLQRSLASLQVASERRDQMTRQLRGQMEKDIQQLKARQQDVRSDLIFKTNDVDDFGDGAAGIAEQEKRIMELETEVSKWEQRYMDDVTSSSTSSRQMSMETSSTSATHRMLRNMDELDVANRHCADMDARVRDLESRLVERDAMIRVLQKHSIDYMDGTSVANTSAYQLSKSNTPRHTPHSSVIDHRSILTDDRSSTASKDAIANVVSLNAGMQSQKQVNQQLSTSSDISVSKESLDEQLKKLDSQLLSKDSIIQALRSEKEKYPNHYWMV